MAESQVNNPLHGITLEQVVTSLVEHHGWPELGKRIAIRCFNSDPSVKSSLKFLRKTPWARKKVEALYLSTIVNRKRRRKKDREAGPPGLITGSTPRT